MKLKAVLVNLNVGLNQIID